MATLGVRLRARRWDELRYHQEDVTRAAGLSPGRLSELERDRHRVAEPTLRRLAVVLAVDPDDLVAHARREDRLAHHLPVRGPRPDAPVGPLPDPVPVRAVPDAPPKPWLTTTEAAAILGITANSVADLIVDGRLGPSMKRTGVGGRGRWLVDAAAVLAYEPANQGRRVRRGPRPVPAGYVSMAAFAKAAGLSHGALHRRLEAGEIASERSGRRRLIPARELHRVSSGASVPIARGTTKLADLPLDGIEATILRLRYGPEPRSLTAVGKLLGMPRSGVSEHEQAALRILRDPAYRAFACGLPPDHPLRRAIFHRPALEAELCGGTDWSKT